MFHEIGFAYHTHQSLAVDYRQAADFVGQHEVCGVAQRRLRGYGQYFIVHGVLDGQGIEQFLLDTTSVSERSEQNAAKKIPLGENAAELTVGVQDRYVPGVVMVNPTFEQVCNELAEEHRELMVLVERVRGLGSIIGLAPLLEELHTSLIKHFSHEQFPGGLYERMGAYGSRYHDELKILVRDHCVILSAVRGLLERTRAADSHDEPALLAEVAEVLAHLHGHEHREHALADMLMALAEKR